ncbi:hypothetical protein [Campylobacter concisus]
MLRYVVSQHKNTRMIAGIISGVVNHKKGKHADETMPLLYRSDR